MLCNFAREQLNKMAGGGQLRDLRARMATMAHVLRCASCRREWRRLRRLNALSHDLSAPALPSSLRAQILAAAPKSAIPVGHLRRGVTLMRVSLITGTCLTLAFAGSFLLLPRHRSALAAQDVRQALANARSWHLKGWKMDGDKRLAWEIWGQRSPFFYRERIGSQETLDDGQNRYLAIPPYPNQKTGLVLKTASRMDINNIGLNYPGLRAMTGLNKEWKRDGSQVTYSVAESWTASDHPLRRNDLYTFEATDPLPKQYSQHQRQYEKTQSGEAFDTGKIAQGTVEKEWEAAHLEAEYNVVIPATVAQIAARPGYALVDATQNVVPSGVPAENAVVSHGITIQATQTLLDAQGNIALVLRPWIGSVPLGEGKPENELPVGFQFKMPDQPHANSMGQFDVPQPQDGVLFRDDRDRAYLPVQTINSLYFHNAPTLLVLTPLEPLKAGEPLPRQITVQIYGDVDQTRQTGGTQTYETSGLLSEHFTFTVNLPARTKPFDDRAIARDVLHIRYEIGPSCSTLAEALVMDRAGYYLNRALHVPGEERKTPQAQALYTQAVRWHKRGIETVRPTSKDMLRSNLTMLQKQWR